MYSKLQTFIQALDPTLISEERKAHLDETASLLKDKIVDNQRLSLNFVCTHNSRRSQFSQIWGGVFAAVYNLPIDCYSSGVEVTAMNERVVKCLQDTGFNIEITDEKSSTNPIYAVRFSDNNSPIIAFSKTYDDASIQKPYVALMTCADADENCPYLPEALARIPLRYEDPKAFDDTDLESKMYAERSEQIARELNYMFNQIKN